MMSQEGYIKDILHHTKMEDSNPISTPADSQSHLVLASEPFHDPKQYKKVVDSLKYAIITRPDIAYAVNRLCQYMHSPTTLHWQAVKQILRYLKGIAHQCLHFTPSRPTSLLAFSNAGWILDKDDNRS